MEISHDLNKSDRLHGYYAYNLNQNDRAQLSPVTPSPVSDTFSRPDRQLFSLNETHSSAEPPE